MNYWLIKSEPETFSIDDLKNSPKGITPWDGVRNYQARNFMRDDMKIGDLAFFYHSNCQEPAIVGIAKVNSKPYPDNSAFDKKSKYYDPKSNKSNPRWILVDFKFKEKFKNPILLQKLKAESKIQDMLILRKGNRLSITPVTKIQWDFILNMGQ